jgi:NADH-quinone oxidoreductase subunit A
MLADYTPILVLWLLAAGVCLLILVLSTVLGPRGENAWKREPFECGSRPIGTARSRFSVKFYIVAILFILFDIEVVFIIPWAVLFRELGVAGFIEMLVFICILLVGLAYVWRKGGLEWE